MEMFELVARRVEETPTLHVCGDVDSASAGALRMALRQVPDGEAIVIDLRKVPFMDSAGLGALVCGFRELRDRGGRMAACVAKGPVRRLLEVSGFDRTIPTAPTLEDALRCVRPTDDSTDPTAVESAAAASN